MDSGTEVEYDEPYDLLQNRKSLLYKMVQQLGKVEATVLIERAKQVSLLQGVVIEVCFHIRSLESPPGVFVPFSVINLQRLSFMTGS